MGGRDLAENVRIPSYEGVGLKLLKKKRHMIFERSLTLVFLNRTGGSLPQGHL